MSHAKTLQISSCNRNISHTLTEERLLIRNNYKTKLNAV